MPLPRPSLDELILRSQRDLTFSIGKGTTILRKAVSKIIGKAVGALAHLIYGYIENLSKELFVSTCTTEEYMTIHAKENHIPRKAANYAAGHVRFTGLLGSTILQDTIVQSDSGIQYRVTYTGVIGASLHIDVNVVAIVSGLLGNCIEGETISLLNEITGVDTDGITVSGGLTGGSDLESFNSWKTRILIKKQQIVLGGRINDWETWVRGCPSFTPSRVWIQPRYAGPRTVGIFFVFDEQENILPNTDNITTMATWLDSVRPLNTVPYVILPTLINVSFTIRINPLTQLIIDAINNALIELFIVQSTVGGSILLSDIRDAVDYAAGTADDEVFALRYNGVSADLDDITVLEGQLAVFDMNNTVYELRS